MYLNTIIKYINNNFIHYNMAITSSLVRDGMLKFAISAYI